MRVIGFQSTLPVRGATRQSPPSEPRYSNFNPRSPCGERRKIKISSGVKSHFNPRSPCGERHLPGGNAAWVFYFNPRSPCGERPEDLRAEALEMMISIHAPRAGSDLSLAACRKNPQSNFNPRSPCGERREAGAGEGDGESFQSTLPVRGATSVL